MSHPVLNTTPVSPRSSSKKCKGIKWVIAITCLLALSIAGVWGYFRWEDGTFARACENGTLGEQAYALMQTTQYVKDIGNAGYDLHNLNYSPAMCDNMPPFPTKGTPQIQIGSCSRDFLFVDIRYELDGKPVHVEMELDEELEIVKNTLEAYTLDDKGYDDAAISLDSAQEKDVLAIVHDRIAQVVEDVCVSMESCELHS